MDTYTLKVAGLERQLPILPVNEKLSIAAFVMFSDVEITVASAAELLKKVGDDFDVILTAETKGIPLAYEMSRQCGKPYVVGRKGVKLYMTDPWSMLSYASWVTCAVVKLRALKMKLALFWNRHE